MPFAAIRKTAATAWLNLQPQDQHRNTLAPVAGTYKITGSSTPSMHLTSLVGAKLLIELRKHYTPYTFRQP